MDNTILAAIITVLGTAITTVAIAYYTHRYKLRNDRRKLAVRARDKYESWRKDIDSAIEEYNRGKEFKWKEHEFPTLVDFKSAGVSTVQMENAAYIISGMLSLPKEKWRRWVMENFNKHETSAAIINGFVNGSLDITKDSIFRDGDHELLTKDFWYPVYFEDKLREFSEDGEGAVEFSWDVSKRIEDYIAQARKKYVLGSPAGESSLRLDMLIRYKLLLEAGYIVTFYANNIVNHEPAKLNIVDKFFYPEKGVISSFFEYIENEYEKSEAKFLKYGKI